jgi:hypothetical protein
MVLYFTLYNSMLEVFLTCFIFPHFYFFVSITYPLFFLLLFLKSKNLLTGVLEIVSCRMFKIFLIFTDSSSLFLYTYGHISNLLLQTLTSVCNCFCKLTVEAFFLCLNYCDNNFPQYVKLCFGSITI